MTVSGFASAIAALLIMSTLPSTSAGLVSKHIRRVEAIAARALTDADQMIARHIGDALSQIDVRLNDANTRATELIGASLSQFDARLSDAMSCLYILLFLVALVVFAMTSRPRPTIGTVDGFLFFSCFLLLNLAITKVVPLAAVVGVLFAGVLECRGRVDKKVMTQRREGKSNEGNSNEGKSNEEKSN